MIPQCYPIPEGMRVDLGVTDILDKTQRSTVKRRRRNIDEDKYPPKENEGKWEGTDEDKYSPHAVISEVNNV